MPHVRGSLVASPEKWESMSSGMSPGLQARFLRVLDLIELAGLEGLPPSIAMRDSDDVWRLRIAAPDGVYRTWIISEAHGEGRSIPYDDGKVRLPQEMRSRLLQLPEVHAEWVRGEGWYQTAALSAITGMEEDDLVIPQEH